MRRILVTQRVELARVGSGGTERRDVLDQAWHEFLSECGLLPFLVPNHVGAAARMFAAIHFDGLLLTGGNDLPAHGGDAPERDAAEALALRHALDAGLPVLGVCRGMQVILDHFGVPLQRVEGHVQSRQTIRIDGVQAEVNSFHQWGCRETCDELETWARADDGVVKAVRHVERPVVGIMWHPERLHPFRAQDVALFRSVFAEPRA